MTVMEPVTATPVHQAARALALEGFAPPDAPRFDSDPAWAALRAAGTRLWLDTGDLAAAREHWTGDFTHLTTNNTLVNREVQKGLFDEVIREACRAFRDADPSLATADLVTEVGFVVNCRTALRLVQAFDAIVSVELHPGMADDVERSVAFGRRYFAVHPERFIIKVPLTPAGFLAARRLSEDGIPVNFTLGFSARQNVLAAAFSRPAYVNVFMGRLNSFVAESGLGSGDNVGERATMATQVALRDGEEQAGWQTLLIGASMRSASQVFDLAGLDVFTMPTGVAEEFRTRFAEAPSEIVSQVPREFPVEAEEMPVLDRLWTVDDGVREAARALAAADTAGWTGTEFAGFVREHGAPGFFRDWSADDRAVIAGDGKIPKWDRWKKDLRSGRVALDDLMTAAALHAFVTDQEALDERIRRILGG